jgi:hypothetical protein
VLFEIVIIKGFYPLDIAKVIRLSDRTFFIGVIKLLKELLSFYGVLEISLIIIFSLTKK